MAIIARLLSNGTYQTNAKFDEVTYTYLPVGSAQFINAYPNGKYLSTTVTAPNTDSVTYEWWFYRTNNTPITQGMLQTRTNTSGSDGIDVSVTVNAGIAKITVSTSGVFYLQNVGPALSLNVWYHIAVVRNGISNWTVWINGSSVGTFSHSTTSGIQLSLGRKSATGFNEFYDGYISNFRYVKGAAVYTSAFTPPTTNLTAITGTDLLLNMVSGPNFLVDSSSNNRTVSNNNSVTSSSLAPFISVSPNKISLNAVYSGGFDEVTIRGSSTAKRETYDGKLLVSNYFDEVTDFSLIGSTISTVTPTIFNSVTIATNDGSPFSTSVNSYRFATQPASAPYNYITVSGGTGFAVGTGDFTIEWFQYQTIAASFPRVFWYGTGTSLGVSLESILYIWGPGATGLGSHGVILNTWVHFALVRISGKVYLYRNGTIVNSGGTNFTNNITDASSIFYIGSKAGSGLQSEQFSGSITSFRFIKGLGVYVGNFTVPTSRLAQTQSANPYGGSNTQAISAGQCSLLLNP